MKNLKISKEISLPIDAVTQTLAAIGRKGAGKTYLATMIAEQMLDAGSQVVAIDPVGNWWGLRVGADGKTKGKEIFVIGGEHGDVPIVPEAGARIAKLIVEKSISAVLDISGFRLGERKRFCADFGEELLHLKKKQRTPVHIFIEEAQLIIPQRVGPEEARMVGAFEQIVRLGRNYGIGCTLVTQRPQSVNKEVLSQVECLCVLQVTGPHERKALEEWVQEAGADRSLVGELPGLARGEGYVWSPAWLRVYERVHFNKKETFDASATPVVGKETKAASLSAVDVQSLKKDLADVVEQAEKDNPAVLRRKVAELEKQLSTKQKTIVNPLAKREDLEIAVKKAEVKRDLLWEKIVKRWVLFTKRILQDIGTVSETTRLMSESRLPDDKPDFLMSPSNVELTDVVPKNFYSESPAKFMIDAPPRFSKVSLQKSENENLGRCPAMIYSFLFKNCHRLYSKKQVAVATGYSIKSSGFKNALSELYTKGLIEKGGVFLKLGLSKPELAIYESEDFSIEKWLENLGKCPRDIYCFLLKNPTEPFGKDEIAQQTQYSIMSSGFKNAISSLNSTGLIIKEGNMVRINPELLEL